MDLAVLVSLAGGTGFLFGVIFGWLLRDAIPNKEWWPYGD